MVAYHLKLFFNSEWKKNLSERIVHEADLNNVVDFKEGEDDWEVELDFGDECSEVKVC
jgi:hypothetical protein